MMGNAAPMVEQVFIWFPPMGMLPGASLWIGPLLGSIDNPPQEIFNEPVYTVTWAPNCQSVIFFADSGLYIAHQPDYTPILIVEGSDNRNGYSGWVLP